MIKFQDYWDTQVERLRKKWTPREMNMVFDECQKSYETGFQYCKYLKNDCDWETLPNEIPRDKDYWWLDSNDKTAVGKVLRSGSFSFLDSHQNKEFNWNLVIKYAEIKPPKLPNNN